MILRANTRNNDKLKDVPTVANFATVQKRSEYVE